MIAHIEGQIAEKSPTRVVLDVHGVGYELMISISTFEALPEVGQRVRLLSHQHVREDQLLLFGFVSAREKWMFTKLISVSGVGPKLALGVLSGSTMEQLAQFIVDGDIDRLSQLPGIGKKTAQRLCLELKDKLGEVVTDGAGATTPISREKSSKLDEAVLALTSLGVSRGDAERNLNRILAREPDLPLDELIRRCLQKAS